MHEKTKPAARAAAPISQSVSAAAAAAAGAERKRIATILKAPAAAGQTLLAQALALDSSMAPEAAIKLLVVANDDAARALAAGAIALARNVQGVKA